jgi:hypothetical protein
VIRKAGGALRVALPDDGMRPLMTRRVRAFFDAFDSVEDALADLRDSMVSRRAPATAVPAWLSAAWQTLRYGRRQKS